MSIFSKIKGAKKAANDKKAQATTEKAAPKPYRHIPTHAAIDALGGAPPAGRKESDRAAIKAANKKRKAAMSRQSSTLSTVTTVDRAGSSRGSTEWRTTTVDQRRPRNMTRASTQMSSLHSLVVPEGEVSQFTPSTRSQNPSPGHSPSGSSSSRESYFPEIPNQRSSPHHRSNIHPKDRVPQPKTRKLGEAPRLLTPPAKTVSAEPKSASTSVAEVSTDRPSKKRRSWMPFNQTKTPAAIAAH